jgi:hypothetical protein
MVIHLAGLFEVRTNTVNFGALINDAESCGVSNAAVNEARILMKEVAAIPSKVAILRSNLFGHRSASLSYEAAFQKADLKPDQLRYLTSVGLKIANTLLRARGLDEQYFHELPRADVRKLINDLEKVNSI